MSIRVAPGITTRGGLANLLGLTAKNLGLTGRSPESALHFAFPEVSGPVPEPGKRRFVAGIERSRVNRIKLVLWRTHHTASTRSSRFSSARAGFHWASKVVFQRFPTDVVLEVGMYLAHPFQRG